jgi:Protein of unknown function (DUF3370)
MLHLLSALTLAQASPLPAPPPGSSRPAPVLQPGAPGSLPPSPLPRVTPPPVILPPQEEVLQPQPLPQQEIFQPQEVRPLPGQLDSVPVVNSNSPEMVQTEGILLSTFPPNGMAQPSAHLNYPLQGRFDVFSHHISKAKTAAETRSLFQGILVFNPTTQPIRLEVHQAASYLTRPDALFLPMPPMIEDPVGNAYSGPGSRVVGDVLRGRRLGTWSPSTIIPARQSLMLMNLPVPAGTVVPTSNGRSTLMRLTSSGPVYVASLAMFAPLTPTGQERSPSVDEWVKLLVSSGVAGPRDLVPTPIQDSVSKVIYGRVSGVAIGSQWKATLTDGPKADSLTVPQKGKRFSYGLSTLHRGTLGTNQIQSGRMAVRYGDTAYQAHGNYGVQYSLTLPLNNPHKQPHTVTVSLQNPIKDDRVKGGLMFFNPPENRVFFRGPVRLRYQDDRGMEQVKYFHLVMLRGQEGQPLLTMTLPKGAKRKVEVDLIYPPDATPPQVLTVQSLND